uniref:Legumin A-like n=1 Tax=Tanacetum cinerariifolium TaxID=118510 RepID=A0A6L2KXS7_TANCI|nr:legumin A-like [Tanacetum cinerariifolium]
MSVGSDNMIWGVKRKYRAFVPYTIYIAFEVVKQAQEQGCQWIAFRTNDNAMINTLAGHASALRAMPLEVIAKAYQMSPQQAWSLKSNAYQMSPHLEGLIMHKLCIVYACLAFCFGIKRWCRWFVVICNFKFTIM